MESIVFDEKIYTIDTIDSFFNFDYEITEKGKKPTIEYIELPVAFDIETSSFYDSNNEKTAIMYLWQLQIFDKTIIGRTWKEFDIFIKYLVEYFGLCDFKIFTIYVHNLSYEFQFIRKHFNFKKVFAIDQRKPIYAQTDNGILFKCSYIQSGYSLETLANNLLIHKINKLVGNLDYEKIRTPLTKITSNELQYGVNDVRIVVAHIYEQMQIEKSITNIPLTKTGYVRRHCKEILTKNKKYMRKIKELTIELDEFKQLKKAFVGGFTHGNFYAIGKIKENVASYDFTSSYPYVMVSEYFPMSKGKKIDTKNASADYIRELLHTCCCVFTAHFKNIRLKKDVPECYISFSKIMEKKDYDTILNNGRIFKAKELTTTITEIDFNIICKTYDFDSIQFSDFWVYQRGYLPKEFIEIVLELYENKTKLKGVQGKESEYMVNKGMANALYGMMVTNFCRDTFNYIGEWETIPAEVQNEIGKYNNKFDRFISYAWGVYVTAHARRNLWTGILACRADYLYSDTDSIKLTNHEKYNNYFNAYNVQAIAKLKRVSEWYDIPFEKFSPTDIKGEKHMLGVWDFEGVYKQFKTLGAKRYIVIDGDGELKLTCSGVAKKDGVQFLLSEFGTPENAIKHFNNKLVFKDTGKLIHTYIDDEKSGFVKDFNGVEYFYNEKSAVHLEPCEYTLGLAKEFITFLTKYVKKIQMKTY